jgi:uncharacterized protein YjiS (DUF1127 family)
MLNRSAQPFSFAALIPQMQPMAPALALWTEALRRRKIRRSYGRMSDAQLRDIGLTPYELEVALSLPFDRDAGDHLAKAAATEAAKW